MQLRIKFVTDEGKESGVCHIFKLVGSEQIKIGEINFSDESDRKWIVRTMVKDHPNVSVIP